MTSILIGVGASLASVLAAGICLRIRYPTLLTDLKFIKIILKVIIEMKRFNRTCYTVIDYFMANVDKHPEKPFILYEERVLTYGEVDKLSNKFAHFVQEDGTLTLKDVAAVFMYNEPEFCWTCLALGKLGVTGALINFNLRSNTLLRCVEMSKASVLICGTDVALINALTAIDSELTDLGIQVWLVGPSVKHPVPSIMKNIMSEIQSQPEHRPSRSLRNGLQLNDSAVYIYTSGTTGLPKPARITWNKLHKGSYVLSIYDKGPDNVVYTSLPMYHSAGYIIAFTGVIRIGMTLAMRRKFSVRHFWKDVRKYKATIIQYIGETCRYLLAAPVDLDDGSYDHVVGLAIGNGLRSDIWEEFQKRFNIQQIGEFYGATEGNQMTFNLDGKVGSCGRQSDFLRMLAGALEIIECDFETSEPIRQKNGLCTVLPSGQIGLLLCKITPTTPADGYVASKVVNDKKLIHNVRKINDSYFNTGDIVHIDKDGYIFFRDRIGDTFRWKGENVATTEVDNVLLDFPGIAEANSYGVEVQGNEGRAGMACIVSHGFCDIKCIELYSHVTERLPIYACPKFLRVVEEMPVTGTYKHRKVEFVNEGFNPEKVKDPMYLFDSSSKRYIPLDIPAYDSVLRGEIRL